MQAGNGKASLKSPPGLATLGNESAKRFDEVLIPTVGMKSDGNLLMISEKYREIPPQF